VTDDGMNKDCGISVLLNTFAHNEPCEEGQIFNLSNHLEFALVCRGANGGFDILFIAVAAVSSPFFLSRRRASRRPSLVS
jgi:hypothetical protein